MGLTIATSDIDNEDDSGKQTRGAPIITPIWNNEPVSGSDGTPRYIIKYFMDGMSKSDGQRVRNALGALSREVCLDFKETSKTSRNAIHVRGPSSGKSGCYSDVGRKSNHKAQVLNLGRGCTSQGTIQHEILHALGFHHEQVRPDRDVSGFGIFGPK